MGHGGGGQAGVRKKQGGEAGMQQPNRCRPRLHAYRMYGAPGCMPTKSMEQQAKLRSAFNPRPSLFPYAVLCRDEAQRLWALKPEFDKLGVGLVCVVHEWIDREVGFAEVSAWG